MTTLSKPSPGDRRKAKQKLKQIGVVNPSSKDIQAYMSFIRGEVNKVSIANCVLMQVDYHIDERGNLTTKDDD